MDLRWIQVFSLIFMSIADAAARAEHTQAPFLKIRQENSGFFKKVMQMIQTPVAISLTLSYMTIKL